MKKNALFITATALVVVSIICLLSFALGGDQATSPSISVSLEGTWKVVSSVSGSTVVTPEAEYIRFSENTAALYRDDLDTPYVSSSYNTDADGNMILRDISRSYKVQEITENLISLSENKNTHMYLARWSDTSSLAVSDAALLSGTWNVLSHAGNTLIDEILVFEDGIMKDYRNGSDDPAITSGFTLRGNLLTLNVNGLELICLQLSEDRLVFVQTSDGLVWEIVRAV